MKKISRGLIVLFTILCLFASCSGSPDVQKIINELPVTAQSTISTPQITSTPSGLLGTPEVTQETQKPAVSMPQEEISQQEESTPEITTQEESTSEPTSQEESAPEITQEESTPEAAQEESAPEITTSEESTPEVSQTPSVHIHSWDNGEITKAPTCLSTGIRTFTCTECHETKTEVIPKTDHTHTSTITAKASTLLTQGHTANEYCSECGLSIVDSATLPLATIRKGNTNYGFNSLNSSEKIVYDALFAASEALMINDSDVNTSLIKLYVEDYDLTTEDMIEVWKVFKNDSPAYYWISNSVVVGDTYIEVLIDSDYINATTRQNIQKNIDDEVIVVSNTLVNTKNDLEKALLIHDYILDNMDYERNSTLANKPEAHNIVGLINGSGVCESYAEAFNYLCNYFDVKSIIVDGVANSENHSWNMIEIEDEWYSVDVTWDDTTNGDDHYYFGLSKSLTEANHTANTSSNTGVLYLYDIPELSENRMSLVKLSKNNISMGYFTSFDAAIDQMTSYADYSIELFSYDYISSSLGEYLQEVEPQVSCHTSIIQLPSVKSLEITSKKVFLEDGHHYNVSSIFFDNDIKCNSDIKLSTVNVYFNDCDLNGYTLEIPSSNQYLVVSTLSTSRIFNGNIKSSSYREASFYNDVDVNNVNNTSSGLRFRGNTTINTVIGSRLTIDGCYCIWNNTLVTTPIEAVIKNINATGNFYLYVEYAANCTVQKVANGANIITKVTSVPGDLFTPTVVIN